VTFLFAPNSTQDEPATTRVALIFKPDEVGYKRKNLNINTNVSITSESKGVIVITQSSENKLSRLTDTQLEERLKQCVAKELEMKIQILHLLAEVEKRRLCSHSHPSLFEYCVKVLKYSGGSAQRRIDTMRAMKLMPEIEQKLNTGDLQMVVVSQAQAFFRQKKKLGKTYDLETKRQIFAKLENKSTRECEKELVAISPQSARSDGRREITADRTELRITLHQELVEKLDQLKALLSNKHPHLTDQELIAVMADIALKKLDPALKRPRNFSKSLPALEVEDSPQASGVTANATQLELKTPLQRTQTRQNTKETVPGVGKPADESWLPNTHTTVKATRYIPATIKHYVWMRDKGRCTHSGCNSKHKLQYDHITPLAKGGETTVMNLRLLCQTHNLLSARNEFGKEKISTYLRKH
jgi:hypothetical protein